ncbi:MAG: FG-GAP-like repeat-containing protein [Bacteroidia bacterium]|nr:FG-GAP-like repeat-containing protein [Bacteroidia bacterium]
MLPIRGSFILTLSLLFFLTSQAQVISSFTPATAKPGSQIRIQGSGFSATASSNIVYFGNLRAVVDSSNTTNVYARAPIGVQTATIMVIVSGVMGESKALFVPTYNCGMAPYAGSFNPKVDFAAVSGNPHTILADIDGDGKLDITTANSNTANVSIMRNLMSAGAAVTTGGFATKVDITAGSGPRIHQVADMDLDGKLDLLVPNYTSGNVSVIRNTSTSGTISFAAKVDFTTGTNPFNVATGDLDADGKPEMVIANYGSGTISIYRNISTPGTITTGSFSLSTTITTGSQAYCVAIADIDGDGKRDLAVANSGANTISLIRNTTTTVGSITFAAKYDLSTSSGAIGVKLADLDNDGKPELIATRANGATTVCVYRNTATSGTIGAGSFAATVNLTTANTPQFFDVADMDGDGKPDLVLPNSSAVSFGVIKNNCTTGTINTGTFTSVVNYTTGVTPTGLSTGDVNGDSIPDVAVANQTNNTVSIFQGLAPTVRGIALFGVSYICKGTTPGLIYNKTGNFIAGNTFTAQLSSDTLGSFTTPVTVGSKSATTNDTIYLSIPSGTPQGRYRLRVVSSSPVTNCTDTGIWVNIYDAPTVNAGSDNFLCIGDSVQLNASATGSTFTWTPTTGLSSATSLTPYSSVTTTTDYILSTSNTYCTVKDTVTLTANNCCLTCKKANTINNNLVLCLPFNGNVNDESGNGYNGTVYSATLTSDRFGVSNKAYSFNGTSSNIELNKYLPDQTNLSISFWLRPTVNPASAKFIFFEGTGACGNDLAISYATNQLAFYASKSSSLNGTAGAGLVNLTSSILNKWTHVVFTLTPSQSKVYINGGLVATFNVSGSNVGYHFTPTLGCLNDGNSGACGTPKGSFFTGDLDDIRYYNTAISAADAAYLFTLKENGLDLIPVADQFVCSVDSVQLVSGNASNYRWFPAAGLSDSLVSNPFAKPGSTTDYIVKGTNADLCAAYDTIRVNVVNNCCNNCTTADSTNTGVVACYPLNTDAKDYVSSLNGVLMSSPALVGGHSGDSTAAYSFNGTSQYIRLGDVLDTLFTKANTRFSIAGWARTTTVTSVSGGGIIVGKTAGTASQWQIYHDNDGRLKAMVCTAADASKLIEKKSNVMAAGQWFHFVLVFDGTQSVDSNKLQFYVNNQAGIVSRLLGAPIGNATANTAQEITIGAGHVQGNPAGITNSYTGRVDEVRFYNTALSAYEAGRLYVQKEKPTYVPLADAYLCLGDSIQLQAGGATIFRWVAGAAISDTTVANPYVKPTVTNNYILNARNVNMCSVADTITVTVQNNCCLNCLAETSINNSLKACLPFDGSVTDKSINANAGTVTGGATLTPDRKGVANKAYDFNGTNSYITYANSTSLSAPNSLLSFSAWVNVRGWTNILGNNIAPIMAKSNSSSTAQYGVALTDKGLTVINNGKIWSYNNLSSAFNLNQWYHIAVVVNNNQVQLYVDGNLSATFAAPSGTFTSSTSNPLTVGKSDPGLTGYFNGKLDEIHLYDRALSAAEVITLYLGKDLLQTTVRSDTTICKGQTVLLGANGATAYTWSPGQFLSDSTIAAPVVTITDSTRFTLKSTDANCLKRDTVKIHVNSVTPVVSNDTTICEQTSTQLSAGGGTAYAWTPAAGLSATNISNPIASPSSTRTYKVTVTKLGCTAQDSVTVTIHNKFVPVVTNDTLLCPVYANVPLNASGAVTYLWSPGSVLSDSTISNPVAFPAYTTKFKVTMSDGICTIIDSVTVTRDTSLHAVATNDTTICEQNSVQISAAGGTSYAWSPSAGLSSVSVFNPVATPAATTKYYVDVSDAFCTLRDSVTVTVKNKFVPVVSNDTSICKGSSLQLNATGAGVISYRWRPATYLNDSTSASPVTTPVTNILYRVVMSDGVCVVTDSVLINRDTLLISSTSNDTTICKGDTAQLFASGGLFYQWSSPGTLNYANIPNPVSYATSTIKYYVDVSDNKCTVRDSVLLTVINFNKVVAPKDTNLCKGDSVLLSASGTGSYTWTPTLGLADPYNKLTKASPPFTTTYVIKTNTLGCITYDTVIVSVQTQVASVVTTTEDTTICQGDTAVLLASSSEPTTAFTWNTGAKTPLIVVKPNTSTWYKVNTKVGSCVGTSDSTFVTVLPHPKAKFVINPADSGSISFNAEFKNQSTNATDFEYFFGDSFNVYGYTPDTNYIYTYPGTFIVKLKVFNQNPGCADSTLMAVKVKDIVSIFIPNAFSPNKDGVNDTFSVVMTGINRCYGIIFDKWGEMIYTQRSFNGKFEWDGTYKGELVQIGVYYYTLQYFEESKKRWYTTTGEIHVIE